MEPIPDDVTPEVALQPDVSESASDWGCRSNGDPNTSGGSRAPPLPTILPVTVVDSYEDPIDFMCLSLSVSDNPLMFTTPEFVDILPVDVYRNCLTGLCTCVHLIGGHPTQLLPCRAAEFLFGDNRLDSIDDDETLYLWEGLVKGFAIVDADCPTTYFCQNYDSILESKAYDEMSATLKQELDEHKVSIVLENPQCVHSLGAVWKSNGKLRPITDCSRPDGVSINNFMDSTFKSFTYNSIQDAVDILAPRDYMAVVDISSAYCSVSVKADQVKYQGLKPAWPAETL